MNKYIFMLVLGIVSQEFVSLEAMENQIVHFVPVSALKRKRPHIKRKERRITFSPHTIKTFIIVSKQERVQKKQRWQYISSRILQEEEEYMAEKLVSQKKTDTQKLSELFTMEKNILLEAPANTSLNEITHSIGTLAEHQDLLCYEELDC